MQSDVRPLAAQVARWDRFRHNRKKALAAEHGWLTLTSYQWLPNTSASLALLPGLWRTDGVAAFLTAAADDGLSVAETGEPAVGTLRVTLANEESLMWVRFGTIIVELARRSGRYAVRTRDSQSPTRLEFDGVPTFDYDPRLVVTGSFEAYPEPRRAVVATYRPDVQSDVVLVGDVVFERDGSRHRLAAEEGALGSLILTFHDETNGTSTDQWRKLETPRPRPDGTVVLDFNRTINYPSAFTAFGTCPQPVEGNRLRIPIEAGERKYRSDDR